MTTLKNLEEKFIMPISKWEQENTKIRSLDKRFANMVLDKLIKSEPVADMDLIKYETLKKYISVKNTLPVFYKLHHLIVVLTDWIRENPTFILSLNPADKAKLDKKLNSLLERFNKKQEYTVSEIKEMEDKAFDLEYDL